MHIAYIEIANFRKLLSVRVDIAEKTTLFVGANNSGKTSALLALRRFLVEQGTKFRTYDFTLSHWSSINAIGKTWETAKEGEEPPPLDPETWLSLLPALDIWLKIENDELHHISALIPTLDWAGGLLGVRMRLEPKDLAALYREYRSALSDAQAMKSAASADALKSGKPEKLTLWPHDMIDFLERRAIITQHFGVRTYPLDPAKIKEPKGGQALPQSLPPGAQPVENNPLFNLIRINEINAQRGFGETNVDEGASVHLESHKLSDQLGSYYVKHLDLSEKPDPTDLEALQAIEAAQDAFNKRLSESFAIAFSEVQGLGYPGVTDPKMKVSTRLRAIDGLNHEAAVSFEIDAIGEAGAAIEPAPEI